MYKIDLKDFPTTRYQGSKRKIVGWIHKYLSQIEFNSVLDACGGTGVVSYLFKRMGKEVTYNDKLGFNYLIGQAIIENNSVVLEDIDISRLLNFSESHPLTFIQDNFEDIYYTKEENIWLDNVIANIIAFNGYSEDVGRYKKALAYYALFQSCLVKRPFNLFHRKNLNLRLNNVPRNFGNKTSWEKPFPLLFQNFSHEVNSFIFDSGVPCFARNESIFEIDSNGYDLVYIDPPYISDKKKDNSVNYLNNYHFLEGIVNYEIWNDLLDSNTKNLRFKGILEGNDFKKSNVLKSLEIIFDRFQNSIIVLSYKNGGIPAINKIETLLKRFKNRTYVRSLHYKYALNNQNGDAKNNREVLIIGI